MDRQKVQKSIEIGVFCLSTLLSLWLVREWVAAPAGYAATYANAGAMLFSVVIGSIGLVLLLLPKGRRLGGICLLSALWLYLSFVAAARTLYSLGKVPWRNERVVNLLPDRGEGLYVYFRPGTSHTQIEQFVTGLRHEYPDVDGFARVTPHVSRDSVALRFRPGLSKEARAALREQLQNEGIVDEVTDHRL